jgi:hypothetical protein
MLNSRDIEELEWFFEPRPSLDSVGAASTLGAQLELASTRYRTSDGRKLPVARIVTVTRELADSTQERPRFAQYPTPWAYAFVAKEKRAAKAPEFPELLDEVGDEGEAGVARLEARRERRQRVLQRLGRLSHEAWGTLERLYGPPGRFWLQRPQGRRWVLLGHTKAGAKQLALLPEPHEARWLLEVAHHTPKPPWLKIALTQAERLEALAVTAWNRTREARPSP